MKTPNKIVISIASILIFITVFFIIRSISYKKIQINRPHQSKFSKALIYGSWKDENSIVIYNKNGTFEGWFGENKKWYYGNFSLNYDTLQMDFPLLKHFPKYIVTKMDSSVFEIQSIDDGKVFLKNKIKFLD